MVATEQIDVRTRPTVAALAATVYGAFCYLAFVAAFLYGVAFLADIIVPRTVDHGGPHSGTATATAATIDALLLAVFAVQHSVMARPAFKRRWTTLVPAYVERSTYVLVASAVQALVFWQWRPIPSVVWDVSAPTARGLLWTLYALGWVWVLVMSFAIDHFDLFGLRQVANRVRRLADEPPSFAVPWPHRLVRHPMMLGFFPAFLATPTMTVGHLLFAVLGCGYVLVGVRLEERDLAEELPEYDAYAAATPRFVPSLTRRGS
jgi:protein-S-isoprenylcysteine O-methyltransferase Ste14